MSFDEWYKSKYCDDTDLRLLKEAMRVAYNAAMFEAAKLYERCKGEKFMDEIELVYDDDNHRARVTVDTDDNYFPVVGSGGYIFNSNGNGYSTPVMDIASARSCYENLRNFFNQQD